MTTLSRAALAAHQTKLVAAGAACDELRKPVRELTDRIDGAKAALRTAESALAALQTAEAEDVVACGPRGTPANFTAKIAAASAEVERRNRALAALEAKMAELRRPLADAELTAGVTASATESLIAGVLADEADNALAEFAAAQVKAAAAEAKIRTLVAHVVASGWLKLAERLSMTLNSTPNPYWGDQQFPRWDLLTSALETDSHAVAPVSQ